MNKCLFVGDNLGVTDPILNILSLKETYVQAENYRLCYIVIKFSVVINARELANYS